MYVSIDAPKFTFVRSENSHIVCMIWTTSNCTVTLNGKSYMNGTWIEQEGEYAFVITNDAKRSTTYKFMVDHYYAKYSMVAPTCTQKAIQYINVWVASVVIMEIISKPKDTNMKQR